MGYFAGLDVSLEETAICIVDDTGKIVREARAASEPDALIAFFAECGMKMERVGLEACSLTAWLNTALTEAAIPAICIEARQAKAAMGANAEQDRPQRCAWDRADHAHRLVPSGAREEPVLPFLADAVNGKASGAQQAPRC